MPDAAWRLDAVAAADAIELAEHIDRQADISGQASEWADHLWNRDLPPPGAPGAPPTLHIDDVSAIPFLQGIVGVEFYQLRARVRAGDGDVYAATCEDSAAYMAYNRDRLALGAPAFVFAEAVGNPACISRACGEGRALAELSRVAAEAGGLAIHPYMGSQPVWELARTLSAHAGVPVRVLAPHPAVTWFANDKAHVSDVAAALCSDGVLGAAPIVETRTATEPQALADHLRELSGRHRRVALKMTRCASAMGNHLFDASAIRALDAPALLAAVSGFLTAKEWQVGQPVLAVAWESTRSSPSTQCWIPPEGAGDPYVEGVYEQLLQGDEQMFLGSIRSELGADLDGRLGQASLRIARVYQRLGYVGRCSLDFIVVGDCAHLVECNGRWGGTSTPMHLMDRLFPAGRPAYRARDYVDPALVGCPLAELLERLGDTLYDARTRRGRYVVYNVGCLLPHGKLDVIAIGEDLDDAAHALEEQLPALLGA